MNIKGITTSVGKYLSKHAPEILTAVGVTGLISSVVLAIRATSKAIPKLDEAYKEKGEPLTVKETVKLVWKDYIPTAAVTIGSAVCMVGSSSVSIRRSAALATAYKLSETAFTDYKAKVKEVVGEKKEKTIKEEVAKEKAQNQTVTEPVYKTKRGETLCLDSLSGRYFMSNIDDIKQVVNKINYRLIQEQFISLNEFYGELDLPDIDLGDDIGWPIGKGLLDVTFGSALSHGNAIIPDGTPCMVIEYPVRPRYEY